MPPSSPPLKKGGRVGFLAKPFQNAKVLGFPIIDDLVKSLLKRHPGESRGPELSEMTGSRLSPE
jgi:hypothetical protein